MKIDSLLFQAAVQEGPGAFESWQCWLELGNLEKADLDTTSFRLLPLVYYNLEGQDFDHPLMNRLKGVYRRAWLENQLSLQQVIPFVTQLYDMGIQVLLLDDLTSILSLYDGKGPHHLYSLDILTHPDDIPKLMDFLKERNIWPNIHFGEHYLQVETPLEVWLPFDLPATISWRLFPEVKTKNQAVEIWKNCKLSMLGEHQVFILDLESHFIRLCFRAIATKPEVSVLALVEIAWMLRKPEGIIDWKKVVDLARLYHQILPVRNCVQEISATQETPRVKELLKQLEDPPVSWMDRLEYQVVDVFKPNPGLFTRIGKQLLHYRRSPKISGLFGFFRYFQYTWGGYNLKSLPRLAWRHFWDKLKFLDL